MILVFSTKKSYLRNNHNVTNNYFMLKLEGEILTLYNHRLRRCLYIQYYIRIIVL